MSVSARCACLAWLLSAVACAQGAAPEYDGGSSSGAGSTGGSGNSGGSGGSSTEGGSSGGGTPGLQVFALDRLHTVVVDIDEQYIESLDSDRETRVPCTFTFDGETLENVGIRLKGGVGSLDSFAGKPAFSVKFNQFVSGLRLDGLRRLSLNNAIEDLTFLSEHIGYESHRRFGLPAPLSAHAVVTVNGEVRGLYVLVEPETNDFLDRNFGPSNDDGNLYEGTFHEDDQSLGDFVTHPEELDLKDEVEEGRDRADIIALGNAIRDTPDAEFPTAVGAQLDLDQYIAAFALDTVLGFRDSYHYSLNNYYLYRNPADDRFVYLPHGMDQLDYTEPGQPMGVLPQRITEIPDLAASFTSERQRARDTYDVPDMLERIDRLETLLDGVASPDGRLADDLDSFAHQVDEVRQAIEAIP